MTAQPTRFTRSFTFLLVGLFVAGPMLAQWFPNQSLGFGDGTFQTGTADSVSLFNGAISLAFPLGLPGLTLTYNSNIWLYEEVWDWEEGEWKVAANPNPIFNAGLGWSLSLGKIYEPADTPINSSDRWMYVGPDGGAHHFYQNLHKGEDDGDDNVLYTRDGSYLRMSKNPGSNHWRKIEFPDGSIHRFSTQGCNSCWYLREIKDRFGNVLSIDYNEDRTEWTLSDQYGRTHYINLEPKCCSIGDQVTSVDLESVGGARAVYTFHYQEVNRNRSCKDTYNVDNFRIRVPLLTRVEAPDGSEIKMLENGQPRYFDTCAPADKPGVISGIRLPTGGEIEWELQEYNFPSTGADYADSSAGVYTKRTYLADGTLDGEWRYKSNKIGTGAERTMRTQVVYPTGDCTKHFFAASPTLDNDNWIGWEYGLPFTRIAEEGGRFLSSEVWPSNDGNGRCSGGETPLRSTYLRFEHDKLTGSTSPENKHKWYNTNRRLAESRTIFHDDGDRYADTVMTEFDGLGHYRSVTTSGNFRDGSASVDSRTTYTHFNRSSGIYAVNPDTNLYCCGHNYQLIPTTTPWVLGVFDYTEISEPYATGETTVRTEYLFDSATGFLKGTRVLENAQDIGEHDLLTEYVEGAYGQVSSVRWYGGDVQQLDSGGIGFGGSFNFPDDWIYRVDHTYDRGVPKTSRYVQPDGTPMPFYAYDVDLDPSTGKVLTSRDPSGMATTYEYDTAGRLWKVIPQEGARAVYSYTAASGTTPASVHVARKTNDGSTTLQQSLTELDPFGRPWKVKQLQPGNGWVEQETLYNPRGWTVSTSALGDLGATTRYLDHDPFGRPGTIRPPDGSQHDVTFDYFGAREVRQTMMVATTPGAETEATRTRRSDRQGRLWQVVESSAPGGGDVTTEVFYDAGNRTTRIETQTSTKPSQEQNRTYTFDGRGFLLDETHPEKGASGNGSVFYGDYDPWGNVGTIADGPSEISFSYDAIGRNTLVQDDLLDRPLKEFTYDGAVGWGSGKLWKAIRHNWADLPRTASGEEDIEVQETYTYNGLGGRVSDLALDISPYGQSFTQSLAYDELGSIQNLTYPDCLHALCPQDEPSRTVSYAYDQGFLTEVTGFAESISYHPNGMWEKIEHENGVWTRLEVDPSGIPRPKAIYTQNVFGGQNWSTGDYAYDGAGNIKAVGLETFLYDGVGRLVEGSAKNNTEEYQYDAFGNLNQVTRTYPDQTEETRAISVSSVNNRLTTATYDAAGSMTQWNGVDYTYDPLHRQTRVDVGQASWVHLYTAGGERVWSVFEPGSPFEPLAETFSIRDPSGRVLRRYLVSSGLGTETWEWVSDQVFRGSSLLASVHPDGGGGESVRHFHLDHLGSPRAVTDSGMVKIFDHAFLPYGEEVTDPGQSDSPFRFTGHERDFQFGTSMDDQDYMHARYYSPHLGRFGRVDPVRGAPGNPMSLNRYTYALGAPVLLRDPQGLCVPEPGTQDCIDVVDSMPSMPWSNPIDWWDIAWAQDFLSWYTDILQTPLMRHAEHVASMVGRVVAVVDNGGNNGGGGGNGGGGNNGGGNDGGGNDGDGGGDGGGKGGGRKKGDCTFTDAWRQNYNQTMSVISPYNHAANFLSAGEWAKTMGTISPLRWAASGFRNATIAGRTATYSALQTATLVGFTAGVNAVLGVNTALGIGVAIGSAFEWELIETGGPYNHPTGIRIRIANCD